jgi:hypothetical protein
MAKFPFGRQAAMVDVDDDRPLGVERGADVATVLRREPGARLAAADDLISCIHSSPLGDRAMSVGRAGGMKARRAVISLEK